MMDATEMNARPLVTNTDETAATWQPVAEVCGKAGKAG